MADGWIYSPYLNDLFLYQVDVLGATTPDKAPNYETLPTEEPSSSPSKTNHTTNPIYTSN